MEHVKKLISTGIRPGDIGILTHTTYAVTDICALLTAAGIEWIDFEELQRKTS
ncbi:MAG: hypothetical protein KF801_01680 [Cryobacterium sp.]|nr:hypothetical protein [Cryobacterium sp.]